MHRKQARIGVLGAIAAGALFAGAVTPAGAHELFYRGRAIGIYTVATVGGTAERLKIADTFDIGCSGDPRDATLAQVANPTPLGINAKGIKAHIVGQNSTSAADTALDELSVVMQGLDLKGAMLDSHSEASCLADGTVKYTGGANVGTLTINGQTYKATGARNQAIKIPNVADIWLNHQSRDGEDFKVTAIRVRLLGGSNQGDLFFGYARAGMHCQP